jgi:hypothetical protein
MVFESVPTNHRVIVLSIRVIDNKDIPRGGPKTVQLVRKGCCEGCETGPLCRWTEAVDLVPKYGHVVGSEVPRGHPIERVVASQQQEEYNKKTQLSSQHI